jgi:hypothetical protein
VFDNSLSTRARTSIGINVYILHITDKDILPAAINLSGLYGNPELLRGYPQ